MSRTDTAVRVIPPPAASGQGRSRRMGSSAPPPLCLGRDKEAARKRPLHAKQRLVPSERRCRNVEKVLTFVAQRADRTRAVLATLATWSSTRTAPNRRDRVRCSTIGRAGREQPMAECVLGGPGGAGGPAATTPCVHPALPLGGGGRVPHPSRGPGGDRGRAAHRRRPRGANGPADRHLPGVRG